MLLAVSYLEQRLGDYDAHRDMLGKTAGASAPDSAIARLGLMALLQMAEFRTLRDLDGLARRWIDQHFQRDGAGYRVLAGSAARIDALAKVDPVDLSPLSVSLRADGYSKEHTRLLRSSAYLFLRSKFARDVYFNEFEDHYAARLWGIFDWNAQEAQDPGAFRSALEKQAPFLRKIAATHEKVIIYVFHTPRWLSGSKDRTDVDGRPAYLLYSPRDYDAWRRFVADTAEFLQQHLADVEVYYEVWNEPEIYWLEDNEAYLRLYEETVAAIRKAHPAAKVGGAAPNGWDGKAKGESGKEAVNLQLIGYATDNDIPLDFISWHYFERPLADVDAARTAYLEALEKHGAKTVPEFVISEWSIPGRGTGNEPVAFAEYMLALYRAGVSMQTVAVWEEFTVLPRPNYFPPWGMLTNQGFRKPMFHVHTFFDRLSRGSAGIGVFESDDGRTRAVVSRKSAGSYELIIWEMRYGRALEAAVDALRKAGLTGKDLEQYGSLEQLESAIRAGQSLNGRHKGAFRDAMEVYRGLAAEGNPVALEFAGVDRLRITASEAVGIRSAGRPVFTEGNRLVADLPRGEVMWLRIEAAD